MNYELAKKLKDAGFPFDFGNETVYDSMPPGYSFDRYPTISELIEACRDVECFDLGSRHNVTKYWYASCSTFTTSEEYSTPEEAVANLWLELNKQ